MDASADRAFLAIDFNGNGIRAYSFAVSLGGSIGDAVWANENQPSSDWDAIWFAKTSQNNNAWFAEFLIPWDVAPLETSDKEFIEINVRTSRGYFFKNEWHGFPKINWTDTKFISRFHPIKIRNFAKNSSSQVDYFPYISISQEEVSGKQENKIGGDIFWAIDSEKRLDVTLNPAFGQVESDDVIVNFSANETFYPDKRPFFTENQSLFEITGQDLRFINTRRIGAIPDKCSNTNKSHLGQCSDYRNDSTDINAALRYTKKGKINEYGFFVALEDNTIFSKGRDFFSGRFKRNLNNSEGTVGYLVTSVDRPSIDRKAFVNTLDFDYKPSGSSRLYGWLSNANVKEEAVLFSPRSSWAHGARRRRARQR